MRHGRPAINTQQWLSALSFGAWVGHYNAAAIDLVNPPPAAAVSQVSQASYVLCSTLPRSLTSAIALGVQTPDCIDEAFRELEIPHAEWRYPILPVSLWLVLFRMLWVFGYHRHTESFAAAKVRGSNCANTLSQLAGTHGNVLFIGHGSLNWFIARALRQAGWRSSDSTPRQYWQYAVFSRTVPELS